VGLSFHWCIFSTLCTYREGGLEPEDAPCGTGGQQSPIDISGVIRARQPPLEISWSKRPDKIVNNGHTIQLSFAEGDKLQMGERKYTLQQLHFHPSEHLVEGKRFGMERISFTVAAAQALNAAFASELGFNFNACC
jgi:carbonic anhydrase